MRPRVSVAGGILLISLTVACSDDSPTGPGDGVQDLDWSAEMEAGETLEIRGVNGSIQAVAASGSTARVTAEKDSEDSPLSSVTFEVVTHAGGVTICAVYPDVPGQPPNECVPGGGQMSVRDNDVTIEFLVQIPEGVRLVEWTVNGNVRALNVRSDVLAQTVNGVATVTTSGSAEAFTVNGNIEATIGDVAPARDLSFEAVNGNVTLTVPAAIDATVRATTVNGTMNSDFLLSNPEPGLWTGTLGSGGSELGMSTVNGNLELFSNP